MDYQDDVKYPQVVAAAAAKGIVVNTIQCGSMSETVAPWQHIATLRIAAATSPWSRPAARSRSRRRSTRRWRRSPPSSTPRASITAPDEQRRLMAAKVEATERLNEEASVAARARRGAFNVSEAGASNLLGESELVDDVASGRVDIAAVPAAQLPAAVAALPVEEQRALLADDRAEARGAATADRDARRGTRRVHRGRDRGRRRRRRLARPADLRSRPRAGRAARLGLRGRAALLIDPPDPRGGCLPPRGSTPRSGRTKSVRRSAYFSAISSVVTEPIPEVVMRRAGLLFGAGLLVGAIAMYFVRGDDAGVTTPAVTFASNDAPSPSATGSSAAACHRLPRARGGLGRRDRAHRALPIRGQSRPRHDRIARIPGRRPAEDREPRRSRSKSC